MKTCFVSYPLFKSVCRWLGIAVSCAFCCSASATPFVTSQMVGFSTGNLGSVGSSEGWNGSSGNLTVTNGSGSLDGTTLGLYPSAGDHAYVAYSSTSNSLNTYNLFATSGFGPANPTNLYYSFLYVFNTTTNMGTTWSNKLIQVNRANSGTASHFEVHAMLNGSGQIMLGVMKTNGVPAYSSHTVAAGQVFFVVVRQEIVAGNGNDNISLWINPPSSSFGATDLSGVPSADAVATVGGEDQSSTGPGRLYFSAGVSAQFDELRVANNWADVTPPVNSCTPASFGSNPTNTTVAEGIAATFYVTSPSSSPTYQWQISTNGGTTWQNVSGGIGGTAAAYTTSPLTTADSGHRYRAVATVVCGGGSTATSTVATVTVNAASPTPLGVVLDDHFDDADRTNAPIGISNSVWFASAASSLDASSGDLVGVPGSGTSRLWIGYLTDDANTPVHLAVGRAIKATLVFTPNNIQAAGANSMRFGLFDYADGGARVTGDAFGSGSTGNGNNVRGYMLTLNFGTTFTANTPEQLLVRSGLNDNNLMGSSADYDTLTNGPIGATLTNAPAFSSGVPYTLELTIERVGNSSVNFTANISGGGTNYSTTIQDSTYAYPRFDALAVRPEMLEDTASSFTFSRLLVQVLNATPAAIPLNVSKSGNNVTLTWSNPAFNLQASATVNGTYTNVFGAVSGYTVPASGSAVFYKLKY